MRPRSLRVRLLVAAAVSILAALVAARFGLVVLFEHHVERRLDQELETYLTQLIGHIEPGADGDIQLTQGLSDPRFEQPLSGLYWQIQDDAHHTLLRSRSLWDHLLPLPRDELTLGVVHRHELDGPAGQSLLVREQQVILLPQTEARRVRIAVAVDRSDLLAARAAFSEDMLPYLVLLGAALMIASWLQVYMGLSPLDQVRQGVLSIRSGRARRLPAGYPNEVQPMVDEINELLELRDKAVEDARAWTADLAHGLKTPLTVLNTDAQRLRARGETDMADDLEQLADSMRRRVDRELIRARLRSEPTVGPQHSDLAKVLQGVVTTLRKTPTGEALAWHLEIPEHAQVNLPPDDLAELLGNLLDNAAKWARSEIRIRVRRDRRWRIDIEDDGPGVPEQQRLQLGQRGLRLDEQTAGSGLGLAIARDIVSTYRGNMEFDLAELGGLAVRLELPT